MMNDRTKKNVFIVGMLMLFWAMAPASAGTITTFSDQSELDLSNVVTAINFDGTVGTSQTIGGARY